MKGGVSIKTQAFLKGKKSKLMYWREDRASEKKTHSALV